MEILRQMPYSDQLVELMKRCEEWLPKSLAKRAVLVGLTTGLVVYYVTKKRYKLPPGPQGWPLIGNMLDFQNTTIYEKLAEWKEQYGPVITFRMGPVTMVGLSSADVILEALVKRQGDFAGRPQDYSMLLFSDGGRNITFGDYSPTWKLHRKLASKALRYYMGGSRLEETIEASLTYAIAQVSQETGPFDPENFTTILMFNIINSICFSYTCDSNDNYLKDMVAIMDVFNNELDNGFLEDLIPPLRLFPTKKLRRFMSLRRRMEEYINRDIRKHRETFSRDNIRDFCDAILLAQLEAQEEEDPVLLSQITDRHITQTMLDIFGGGFDTARITMLWALLYLAKYPDIQDKVYQETEQALGARKYPRMSDRSSLPYTDAVMHEVVRISLFAPMGLPHTTICDTKIGDYDIPKGTTVLINLYAVHHDPEHWDHPEVFKPERFLDENGKMASKPYSFLPFSAGKRVCLGESVAKPELQLLLAGIIKQLKVALPPGLEISTKLRGGSFTNIPNDFEILVEQRI